MTLHVSRDSAVLLLREELCLVEYSVHVSRLQLLYILMEFHIGPIQGEDGFREEDEGDGGGWEEPQELEPPEDQLELSEKELKEEFTRVLTADNPHAPQNLVRFNFKESTFKQVHVYT